MQRTLSVRRETDLVTDIVFVDDDAGPVLVIEQTLVGTYVVCDLTRSAEGDTITQSLATYLASDSAYLLLTVPQLRTEAIAIAAETEVLYAIANPGAHG
jgi:hypothetical protein